MQRLSALALALACFTACNGEDKTNTQQSNPGQTRDGITPTPDTTDSKQFATPAPLALELALTLDSNTLVTEQTLSASVTITNERTTPYELGGLYIAATPPGATHETVLRFTPEISARALLPGESLTLTASRAFTAADPIGTWEAIAVMQAGDGALFETDAVAFAHISPSLSETPPASPPILPPPSTPLVEPATPGAAAVRFDIRADKDTHTISPLIYGINQLKNLGTTQRGTGFVRSGGNRYTAYNWENNASHAGIDYNNVNDGYLVAGRANPDAPGETVRYRTQEALATGAQTLVTIPMLGYVAADKNGGGDVNGTANYLTTRFKKTVARKNAPFTMTPSTTDAFVYQDEFVSWVKATFPDAFAGAKAKIAFSLDNEPDLWSSTHVRIHPNGVQAQELIDKTIEYAAAVKSVAPNADTYGFVSYGYLGLKDLQHAYSGDFTEHFLASMKEAEQQHGKRLVDVFDLHWYPEARGDNCRINGTCVTAGAVTARVQAPRSLWDPTYNETSWVRNDNGGPLQVIPTLRKKIAANYPGTKIAFTEYYYGGGTHISGAIAEADVLGIFGREDVHAANLWEQGASDMIYSAMRMFTSYDGDKGHFGDTSVRATTSNIDGTSVYASIDAANPSRMVIVAINKTAAAIDTSLALAAYGSYSAADVYRLAGTSTTIAKTTGLTASGTNAFVYSMPAYSISVIVPH